MVKLGDVVKDSITGFRGKVTGITEYLYGCKQALVTPQKMKDDGTAFDSQWIDDQRLDAQSEVKCGGPQPTPPQRSHPPA